MGRSTVQVALSFLPAGALAFGLVPEQQAEACGPYGSGERPVVVQVAARVPASDGITVTAMCGEEVVDATDLGDGRFVLFGLTGRSCRIKATAHECYRTDREVVRTVKLPRSRLVLTIPDAAD